jgi:hypothetical protein
MKTSTLSAITALAAFFLAAAPLAQDGEEPDFPTMEEILGGDSADEDPQARMKALFQSVESKLKDVDILLSDAAAGDTSRLAEVEESGIADLLRSSLQQGRAAQKDIEEILEIAQQMGQQQKSQSSSSGQGQQQGQGNPENSPLDRGQQSQSQEQTPEAPSQSQGQEQQGEQPKPGEGEGEQPDPNGETPKPDSKDGTNRDDGTGGDGATAGATPPGGADDNWGNLPSHVKDAFRTEGRSELPSRYRDWIDDYYKKLNRRARRN